MGIILTVGHGLQWLGSLTQQRLLVVVELLSTTGLFCKWWDLFIEYQYQVFIRRTAAHCYCQKGEDNCKRTSHEGPWISSKYGPRPDGDPGRTVFIYLGLTDIESPREQMIKYGIERIQLPEEFSQMEFINDIALIKTREYISFIPGKIMPVRFLCHR